MNKIYILYFIIALVISLLLYFIVFKKYIKQNYTSPEVYCVVGPTGITSPNMIPSFTKDQAKFIAYQLGGNIATSEQLYKAYLAGARWSINAWINNVNPANDTLVGQYPMADGIHEGYIVNNLAMLTVYGIKPIKSQAITNKWQVLPFNGSKWSMFD